MRNYLIYTLTIIFLYVANTSVFGQGNKRTENDFFGYSVAIYGNSAIIGAPQEDEDETGENTVENAGAAYLYERNDQGKWEQIQKIVATDREENALFGSSVAIYGNYAVVGAYLQDSVNGKTIPDAGAIYVFEKNGFGVWEEIQKLTASDAVESDYFGYSVSISENYIFSGAYNADKNEYGANVQNNAGAVYVFRRSTAGYWEKAQKLTSTDRFANDNFGFSVAINDDYAIIGAPMEDHDLAGNNFINAAGSAYLFKRTGNNWAQQQKIIASDRSASDLFGYSVAIDNDVCIVAAYKEDDGEINKDAGAVYVFNKNASGQWVETQKLISSDRIMYDFFGCSVAISGNYLVIGAYAEDEDENGQNTLSSAGSAYIFHKQNGTWSQYQKITPKNRRAQDYFGYSVAIDGNYCMAGAYQEDEDANDENFVESAGSVYVFEDLGISSEIKQVENVVSFTAYPNPVVNGEINVLFNQHQEECDIRIMNAMGQTVYLQHYSALDNFIRIPLIGLQNDGMYILSINNVGTSKFIFRKE